MFVQGSISTPRLLGSNRWRLWNTGSSAFADDDSGAYCGIAPYAAGTGSAVTDLIFSIANREVTFFSGTALISFL